MPDTCFPCTTLDGEPLDLWCNEVDSALGRFRDAVTEFAENHPGGKAFDPSVIPSEAQREGFMLMMKLLSWAESFSGTLRYDVCVDHTDCPEHDEWMRRKIAKCKEDLLSHS
jgi:hypothetical protein